MSTEVVMQLINEENCNSFDFHKEQGGKKKINSPASFSSFQFYFSTHILDSYKEWNEYGIYNHNEEWESHSRLFYIFSLYEMSLWIKWINERMNEGKSKGRINDEWTSQNDGTSIR